MKIKQIEVEYAETVSYGQFANARIGRRYVAEVEIDRTPREVDEFLSQWAKREVRKEVDTVLEENGEQPKYYEGALYYIHISRKAGVVLVSAVNLKLPEEYDFNFYFNNLYGRIYTVPMRKQTQVLKAHELAEKEGFTIFIADSEETLKGLPALPAAAPEIVYADLSGEHATSHQSDPLEDYQELEY